MIMADVFKILFLILGTLITLVSYWLLFEACVPRFVVRAQRAYEQRPLKLLLQGLAIAGPLLVLGLVLLNAGNGALKLAGAILLLLMLLVALMGSTGFAGLIGQRLRGPADAAQPWRRVLRGGTVVGITFVFPLLGWFVLLPAVLFSGVGAAMHARPPRETPAQQPVAA